MATLYIRQDFVERVSSAGDKYTGEWEIVSSVSPESFIRIGDTMAQKKAEHRSVNSRAERRLKEILTRGPVHPSDHYTEEHQKSNPPRLDRTFARDLLRPTHSLIIPF